MSVDAMNWYFEQDCKLSSSERAVLTLVCWRHNRWREVKMTQRFISRKLTMSKNTVTDAISSLAKKDLLRTEQRDGKRGPTTFLLKLDEVIEPCQ